LDIVLKCSLFGSASDSSSLEFVRYTNFVIIIMVRKILNNAGDIFNAVVTEKKSAKSKRH